MGKSVPVSMQNTVVRSTSILQMLQVISTLHDPTFELGTETVETESDPLVCFLFSRGTIVPTLEVKCQIMFFLPIFFLSAVLRHTWFHCSNGGCLGSQLRPRQPKPIDVNQIAAAVDLLPAIGQRCAALPLAQSTICEVYNRRISEAAELPLFETNKKQSGKSGAT